MLSVLDLGLGTQYIITLTFQEVFLTTAVYGSKGTDKQCGDHVNKKNVALIAAL